MIRSVTGIVSCVILAVSVAAASSIPGVNAGNQKFSLDNKVGKNTIEFFSQAPLEDIHGTANGISGTFTLNPANLEATTGQLKVVVTSMKTDISKRDQHLYSNVWLDAATYPEIVYTVTGLTNVTVTQDNGKSTVNAQATGTFTMHGVTKPLSAQITLTYVPENTATKKRAPGNFTMITATFNVRLADYNVKGKDGSIGSSVGETIAVTAKLFARS